MQLVKQTRCTFNSRRWIPGMFFWVIAASISATPACAEPDAVFDISPSAETAPVSTPEDSADDPCIWLHPTDRALSVIIGTNKKGGLVVFDLKGNILQDLATGKPNNVDIRYGFPLAGQPTDIVAASNRSDNTLAIYRMNPGARMLEDITAAPIRTGIEAYGFCMYHNSKTGQYFAFVNAKDGTVQQWKLEETEGGKIGAQLVRTFCVGSQVEGCVADDEAGFLFVSEENIGIWRYGAEPDFNPDKRMLVDLVGPRGHLAADIEGLAIYYGKNGAGHLIASSQGNNMFVLYQRTEPYAYEKSFRIVEGNGIDGVTETDGLDVTHESLGSAYPKGLLVVQDGDNGSDNQNFKLISWDNVEAGLSSSSK